MLTPANLRERYAQKKGAIAARLAEFARIPKGGPDTLLPELVFCVCAANTSAEAAFRAQRRLVEDGLLHSDRPERIADALLASRVRFHRNKARYIISARADLFERGGLEAMLAEVERGGHASTHRKHASLRDLLCERTLGLGMKEAGHFLRNTGLGPEVAILDRHILANLLSLGVVKRWPPTLTPRRYRLIERRMDRFSQEVGIPLSHLDLLMWSEQTGRIFK